MARCRRPVSFAHAAWGIVAPFVLGAAACSHESTMDRVVPPRSSLGAELFAVVCSRVGAQNLPEDVSGASYRTLCHAEGGASGATGGGRVNRALLPTLVGTGVEQAEARRALGIAKLEALAEHRAALVEAFDFLFPADARVPKVSTGTTKAGRGCTIADGSDDGTESLRDALAGVLGRTTDLYHDGTLPRLTQSFGELMDDLARTPDAQHALSRSSPREGYRPVDMAAGLLGAVSRYPELAALARDGLRAFASDSDPYAMMPDVSGSTPRVEDATAEGAWAEGDRVPMAGPAHAALGSLLSSIGAHLESLRDGSDDPPADAEERLDDAVGRSWVTAPRTAESWMRSFMLRAHGDRSAGVRPAWLVRRDRRGVALVARSAPAGAPTQSSADWSPFVDADGDGLADLDPFGRFVLASGSAPTPFPTGSASPVDTGERDEFGRALRPDRSEPLYLYVDASGTHAESLVRAVRHLASPRTAGGAPLDGLLAGLSVLTGPRVEGQTKCFARGNGALARCDEPAHTSPIRVSYTGFAADRSPLVDVVHAAGQWLSDPGTEATLALVTRMLEDRDSPLARVVKGLLDAYAWAESDTNAKLRAGSSFWDDALRIVDDIAQEPGLLERVFVALTEAESAKLGAAVSGFMAHRDHISYDRSNLNGGPFNVTQGSAVPPAALVDHTSADTGPNRSQFQRFLAILHDTSGVAYCNKSGARVRARLGVLNVTLPVFGTYGECEVYKVDDLADFYLRSIIGQATLHLRPSVLRNGIPVIGGAATVELMEQSSGIKGFWDGPDSRLLRPRPEYLNRLVYFDQDADRRAPTRDFLFDLNGPDAGTRACTARTIDDPVADAADARTDRKIRGLRTCSPRDTLRARHPDTLFVLENFGAYDAFSPLLRAFAAPGKDRLRWFIDLMGVVHAHWGTDRQSAAECNLGFVPGSTTAKTCAASGAVTYEPLLARIFSSDTIDGARSLLSYVKDLRIDVCTDRTDGRCTATEARSGIEVLADATRALVDSARASRTGIRARASTSSTSRDGTDGGNRHLTPLDLLRRGLGAMDDAWARPDAPPHADMRRARWRSMRSELVDAVLAVEGSGESARFASDRARVVARDVVELLRQEWAARCPESLRAPYPRCAWAGDTLAEDLADTLRDPVFAALVDVADALRNDERAAKALGDLTAHLLNEAHSSHAALVAAAFDGIERLRDRKTLAPVLRLVGATLRRGLVDGAGQIDEDGGNLVQASLNALTRFGAHARTREGGRDCRREVDPAAVLPLVTARLFRPMGSAGRAAQTPMGVFADAIAAVHRAEPPSSVPLSADDYASIGRELREFFLDRERGLEQFYEVVRRGTSRP